jgi:hypothetical protein
VELAYRFGALASWWLQPLLVERMSMELGCRFPKPSLPAGHGSCWIVMAQQPRRRWPSLRDAFLLPLQWRQGARHGRNLPSKLVDLAQSIAAILSLHDWSIHVNPALDSGRLDLSGADEFLDLRSGWASLAAGLLVASAGGRPDPAVWASGAWDERGIGRVELGAKLELAVEYGVRRFFVPESQAEEAKRAFLSHESGVEPGALVEGTADVRAALRDFLRELDVPPGGDEARAVRAAYYLRQVDDEWAKRYYRENLLPEIVASLRGQWESRAGRAVMRLVTIASDNPELVRIAVAAIRPERCLILHTLDKRPMLEEVESMYAMEHTCEIVPVPFESPAALLTGAGSAVDEFSRGVPADSVVIDLTPGTKEMSMVLAFEVAKPGNRLLYLRHERRGARVVPFSEDLRIWPAGQGSTHLEKIPGGVS